MSNPVTKYEYPDGAVFLHTHLAVKGEEITEALAPYVGREMNAYLFNDRGHYLTHKVKLLEISGNRVKLELNYGGHRWFRARDAFGSNGQGTVIHPA